MKKMLKENKGFSLVELLIALLIMAVIAGTAITLFGGVLETSKSGADKETAASIERALLTYVNASNDVDLNCLGIKDGDNSSAVIDALSKRIVITATSSKVGSTTLTSITPDDSDMPGEYGPFLDDGTITPSQNGKDGWKITYNTVSQVITVESVDKAADAKITIDKTSPWS